MLLPILLTIATSAVTEPVDFNLGFKIGDKYTYVVSELTPLPIKIDTTAEFVLTVVGVNDKAISVKNSPIDYTKTMQTVPSGTSRITRKGKVLSASSNGIRNYLRSFLLPQKPVDVGDEYKLVFDLGDQQVPMAGTFVKRDGEDDVFAHFAMSGVIGENDNMKVVLSVKSVFDMKRSIFVSATVEFADTMNDSFKSVSTIMLKGFKKTVSTIHN